MIPADDLATLRRIIPDREWEDRGSHLYRTREVHGGWRYVLIEPERVRAKPIRISFDPEEPDRFEERLERISAAYASGGASRDAARIPGMEAELRRQLQQKIEYQRLPTCVVPDCKEKAPYVFKAAERGRLAGRDWEWGDEIRTCPEHGKDIYMAQGAYGRDQLAEWLRPDAKLDPLDAYDVATDLLHRFEIEQARARMLRVKIPAEGQS